MAATDDDSMKKAEEAQRSFVASLEQTGQLADVAEGQDTKSLPAKITHVRYPDGRIVRIRFTGYGSQKS